MLTLADAISLRVLYTAALIAAGGAGAVTLVAPKLAAEKLFYGAVEVGVYMRILGAVWLGLGVIAGIGLVHPLEMAGILLVQLVYKTAWVVLAALPAIISGKRDTALLLLTIVFSIWALAILFLFPFAVVFA
ncbi:MAG: hypothetical protein ACFE0P_07090 [Oceanicaulis sp.]